MGLDPTKNGGDLLWTKAFWIPCAGLAPWSLASSLTGPTGDIAAVGVCNPVGNYGVTGYRWNGSGSLVGSSFLHQGGTGTLTVKAQFGRHQDLAILTSRYKYTYEQHLSSDVDGVDWVSMAPTEFGPWDSDALGNFFVAADAGYTPSLTLGNIQFPAAGRYLVRTGSLGTSFQANFSGSLTADQVGGVYRSGALPGALDLGCGPMAPTSASSGYIARLDSALTCLYSHPLPVVASVLASAGGAVILTAASSTPLDLGCGTLSGAAGGSTFVTGLDGAGSCVFGKSFPAPKLAVTVDPSGRVVVSGFVGALPIDLGGGPLAPIGAADFVVAELDAAGHHLWSRRFGAAGVTFGGGSVSTSAAGDVYLLTSFGGGVDLGGGVVTAASKDTVLASFTPSGQLRFARALPITGASAMRIDGCGALVVMSTGPSFDPGCGEVFSAPWPTESALALARFAP